VNDTATHKLRLYSSAVPALIAILITVALFLTSGLWEDVELRAYDLRLRAVEKLGLGEGGYTGNVVVVGMEEDSIVREKPLIFWYPDLGRFLWKMREYDARVVGIDLIPVHSLGEKIKDAAFSVFPSEPDEGSVELLESIGELADNSLLSPMLEVTDRLGIVQGVAGGIVPYYYGFMAFMHNVYKASVSLTPDNDNIIRRQRLGFEDSLDSFAYSIYKLQGGGEVEPDTITLNYLLKKSIPYFSFTDIMAGEVPGENFSGKAVLLGYITGYDDMHFTPMGISIDGIMLHAITVETLFSGTSMKSVSILLEALVLVALSAAGLMLSLRLRPFIALSGISLVMAAYVTANLNMFSKGSLMALFPHMLAPFLVFTAIYPYRYLVEEKRKKKIYKTLSYYVDKKVIDSLIDKDVESLLRGEQRDICVMFIDIRDFTGLIQHRNAEDIIRFLNIFFDRLTETIQKHNGFVDKFIGDAVMAFFATDENPVDNALIASREILRKVDEFNNDSSVSSLTGEWGIRIGIGVDYGRVIMGNIGSEKKMDFTIIGEPVNKAARLEELTKRLGEPLLVGDSAYAVAGGGFNFKHLGKFDVRGLKKSIDIYTIA
jgi:class 3 adenylate cyclase